jgi:molybdate transport system regulatory protein
MKVTENKILDEIKIKINIRFEKKDGVIFGHGRFLILDEIEKHGSLKKAAEAIGMSYRAAWGKIKNSERILGEKLIKKITNKEGYQLTDFGKQLKNKFQQFYLETEDYAKEKFKRDFDFLLK